MLCRRIAARWSAGGWIASRSFFTDSDGRTAGAGGNRRTDEKEGNVECTLRDPGLGPAAVSYTHLSASTSLLKAGLEEIKRRGSAQQPEHAKAEAVKTPSSSKPQLSAASSPDGDIIASLHYSDKKDTLPPVTKTCLLYTSRCV